MTVHVTCDTSEPPDSLARNAVAAKSYIYTGWLHLSASQLVLFDDGIRVLPYVKDMIDLACIDLSDSDAVVITNADIGFYPGKCQQIDKAISDGKVVMSHRMNINESYQALALGYDLFGFTVGWWKKNGILFPNLLLGTEYWDACFKELVKRTNTKHVEINDAIYHYDHDSVWCRPENIHTLQSQIHNKTLARQFFKQWSEIDYLELAKIDIGSVGSGELYLKIARLLMGDTSSKSLIDLCCGEMTSSRHLRFKESVHVDVVNEPLRPDDVYFFHGNVLGNGEVFERNYDVALCSDGIGYLEKADGLWLAERMTKLAKLSVIFTPLGDLNLDPAGEGPHCHRSGWMPQDLPGWSVLEMPNWHQTLGIGAVWFFKELVDDSH